MTEEEIERINRFIDLRSLKSNRNMIRKCIFLIIVLFMFFISNSLFQNFNLLKSWWMIFAVIAVFLIGWGIYLLYTLEKHQIQFFLFWSAAGIYYTAEFLSIGISYGKNVAHINIVLLILLVFIDISLLLLLAWYRVQLFRGKKEIKSGTPNYRMMIPCILILSPILIMIFKNTQDHIQPTIMTLILMFIGYAESVHVSFLGNYYVAKKYQSYIHLYENKGTTNKAKPINK